MSLCRLASWWALSPIVLSLSPIVLAVFPVR